MIAGLRRSPGEGHGNPLQYSCLGNLMNRGAWKVIVHGVAKELDMTEQLNYKKERSLVCEPRPWLSGLLVTTFSSEHPSDGVSRPGKPQSQTPGSTRREDMGVAQGPLGRLESEFPFGGSIVQQGKNIV